MFRFRNLEIVFRKNKNKYSLLIDYFDLDNIIYKEYELQQCDFKRLYKFTKRLFKELEQFLEQKAKEKAKETLKTIRDVLRALYFKDIYNCKIIDKNCVIVVLYDNEVLLEIEYKKEHKEKSRILNSILKTKEYYFKL